MKKKWISYLLSLSMVAGSLSPVTVGAADLFSSGGDEAVMVPAPAGNTSGMDVISEDAESAAGEEMFGEDAFGDGEIWGSGVANDGMIISETTEPADQTAPGETDGQAALVDDPNNHAPVPKDGKTEYVDYINKKGQGSSGYYYYSPADYFEDEDEGDVLTYEVTHNGEPVTLGSDGKFYIPINWESTQEEYIITATDSCGAVSEPVSVKAVVLGIMLELEKDKISTTANGLSYYLYEENADNQLVGKVSYTLAGKPVEKLPEGMELLWTTSDAKVAAVDENGVFTIQKPESDILRSVTLVAYAPKDGKPSYYDGYYGSAYICVLPRALEFTGYTVAMPEDGYLPEPILERWNCQSYYNGQDLSVVSTNPEVAVIEKNQNGYPLITPKKPGTAKVLVTWNVNKEMYDVFDIKVEGVKVAPKENKGSIITIDPTSEEPAALALEAFGTEADETFTWSSSNEEIATVSQDGVVTAHKEGSVVIYATSSLTTEEKEVKGGIILQVQESKKAYLDQISFASFAAFEGWTSAVSGFHSAQLDNKINIKNQNNSVSALIFTPYFNNERFEAVLSSQSYGGAYADTVLENGVQVTKTEALQPGHNLIYITVSDKTKAEADTKYTFDIYRPYTTQNRLSSLTLLPGGETALAYPTYNNRQEGTLFQYDPDTDTLGQAYFSGYNTVYKAFVYGKRTKGITFNPRFEDAHEHVYLSKDGGEKVEAVTQWPSEMKELNEEGTTVFTYEIMSDQAWADAHAKAKEEGREFDFTVDFVPETTYTIYVENVTPLGIDAEIKEAEVTGGTFYKPGFSPNVYSHNILLDSGKTEAELTFKVPEGIDVYNGTVADSNKMESTSAEEGLLSYSVKVTAGRAVSVNLVDYNEDKTQNGKSAYSFTGSARGEKDMAPDEIVDYLCLGSQYTNMTSYGMQPERTLAGSGGVLSVGNFGGYITYKYDKPILNDPKNPYGVDFVAYGNPFQVSAGAAEPGNVLVSQDGEEWYYLAGSMYFDNASDWNYSITCTDDGNGNNVWTDSNGDGGTNYKFPKAELYPYHNWTEETKKSITATGVRLTNDTSDDYGSASAAFPDFGYVDVNGAGGKAGVADNPYKGSHSSLGDAFDLDWAVDENGNPVHLDSISYIKISTASCIYAGAIGEKSTEVTCVRRTSNAAEEAVGRTNAPESITINGTEVSLDEEVVTAACPSANIDVKVSVPEGTNVYINGAYGTERVYEKVPNHRMLRIITQEGEKEPDIRYIHLEAPKAAESITLDQNEVSVKEGESFALTAAVAPEDAADEVVWTSSDEAVAVVEDGVVSTVGKGTAVITVTAGSVSAECTVTVTCNHSKKTYLIVDEAATCAKEGKGHRLCTECDEVIEDNIVFQKLAHTWGEWKETKAATHTECGEKEHTCTVCGEKQTAVIVPLGKVDIAGATVTGIVDRGYTGKALTFSKLAVKVDGKLLTPGKDYTVSYKNNTNIGTASVTVTGNGIYAGTFTKIFAIKAAKGKVYNVDGIKYKITNSRTDGKGTVSVAGTTKSKSKLTALTIKATVKIGGKNFKITAVSPNAFKNYTRLMRVKLGGNMKIIGRNAFYGCKNLKSVVITSRQITTVGKNAVKNIRKYAVIDVKNSMVKTYKKLFKSSTGFKKTMKVK